MKKSDVHFVGEFCETVFLSPESPGTVSDSLVNPMKCNEYSSPEDSYQTLYCGDRYWENIPQVKGLDSVSDTATRLCEHQQVIHIVKFLAIKWGYGEAPIGKRRFIIHMSQP